jgi:nitrate reductase beta subunit
MRTLILAATLASTAMLSLPAKAVEVCDKTCVGPACVKDCVRAPSPTVGRRDRDEVIIEERTRRSREPGVEIREERRPGVEVEVGR